MPKLARCCHCHDAGHGTTLNPPLPAAWRLWLGSTAGSASLLNLCPVVHPTLRTLLGSLATQPSAPTRSSPRHSLLLAARAAAHCSLPPPRLPIPEVFPLDLCCTPLHLPAPAWHIQPAGLSSPARHSSGLLLHTCPCPVRCTKPTDLSSTPGVSILHPGSSKPACRRDGTYSWPPLPPVLKVAPFPLHPQRRPRGATWFAPPPNFTPSVFHPLITDPQNCTFSLSTPAHAACLPQLSPSQHHSLLGWHLGGSLNCNK